MSHCSRPGPQALRAARFASSGHSAPGAGPSLGSPTRQNHLLRLPNNSFKRDGYGLPFSIWTSGRPPLNSSVRPVIALRSFRTDSVRRRSSRLHIIAPTHFIFHSAALGHAHRSRTAARTPAPKQRAGVSGAYSCCGQVVGGVLAQTLRFAWSRCKASGRLA